ncbi:MAG: hypothetical protein AB1898_09510 [Acidobacteriota bacterium]
MSEYAPDFIALLTRSGHQPKHAKRWVCYTCPPGKPAAMSVDAEHGVFFCHRCGRGGNAITLRRLLSIPRPTLSRQDRRAYAHRKETCQRQTHEFLSSVATIRAKKVDEFQHAYDIELKMRDQARTNAGAVPEDVVLRAFHAATAKDRLEAELALLDDPSNLSALIQGWRAGRGAA